MMESEDLRYYKTYMDVVDEFNLSNTISNETLIDILKEKLEKFPVTKEVTQSEKETAIIYNFFIEKLYTESKNTVNNKDYTSAVILGRTYLDKIKEVIKNENTLNEIDIITGNTFRQLVNKNKLNFLLKELPEYVSQYAEIRYINEEEVNQKFIKCKNYIDNIFKKSNLNDLYSKYKKWFNILNKYEIDGRNKKENLL